MLDREPLLNRATIVSIVTALVVLAGSIGYQVGPQVQSAVVALLTLVALVAPIVTAALARRHVTPVADPQAADGTPLVPAVTPPPAPELVDPPPPAAS